MGYIKGGNGKIYEETHDPSTGQVSYLEVQAEGVEIGPHGELLPIRNREVRAQQTNADSHKGFFQSKNFQDDKQRIRRAKLLEEEVAKAVLGRATDVRGPGIKVVSDSDFMSMRQDPDFIPLPAYAHKLITSSGKEIRPILAGEVGMYKDSICILEPGEKNFKSGEISPGSTTSTNNGA